MKQESAHRDLVASLHRLLASPLCFTSSGARRATRARPPLTLLRVLMLTRPLFSAASPPLGVPAGGLRRSARKNRDPGKAIRRGRSQIPASSPHSIEFLILVCCLLLLLSDVAARADGVSVCLSVGTSVYRGRSSPLVRICAVARLICRISRVYFRKQCFVCSDTLQVS